MIQRRAESCRELSRDDFTAKVQGQTSFQTLIRERGKRQHASIGWNLSGYAAGEPADFSARYLRIAHACGLLKIRRDHILAGHFGRLAAGQNAEPLDVQR